MMRKMTNVAFILIIGILIVVGITFDGKRAISQGIDEQNASILSDSIVTAPQTKETQKESHTELAIRKYTNHRKSVQIAQMDQPTKPKTQTNRSGPKKQYYQAKPFKIDVSIGEQKVRIYKDNDVLQEFTVSTGSDNCTPLGTFTIQTKGEWFFSEKYQQGGKWWVRFKGDYLFHSVPMDREQNIIPEEAAKLGTPCSHGCIRLEVEDTKWIYDNIPTGTPVFIHN
jgi:lipoprotein-anchoring transpeptidase ErfK/SrfK